MRDAIVALIALSAMDGRGVVVGSLAEIIQLRLTDASFAPLPSYGADRPGAAVQEIR